MNRGSNRTRRSWESDGEEWYDDEEDEYIYQRRQLQQRPRRRGRPVRRRRSIWPALLTGCALGIVLTVLAAAAVVFFTFKSLSGAIPVGNLGGVGGLDSTKVFTQQQSQSFLLTALSQVQVCNEIGNVTISTTSATGTGSTGNAITVTTEKVVHSTNQSSANQEFGRITVTTQTSMLSSGTSVAACAPFSSTAPANTTNTVVQSATSNANALEVDASVPDTSGILRGTNDSVNVTISIPAGLLANAQPAFLLTVNAPLGNITVNGVSGNLQLKDSSGNITVSQAVLALGSHIETGEGNVTFNGALAIAQPAQGGSNANSAPTSYIIQTEQGNIDVTLPIGTNVIIDANTNVGQIKANDFALPIQSSDGSMSYNGPLQPSSSNKPTTVLVLDVSTGNVTLHKASIDATGG
jgi:hypothetical protein